MARTPAALLAALAATCLACPAAAQDGAAIDRSQDAAWMNAQQAALASRQAADGWYWMDGGVLWRRVAGEGTGARPTLADTVTVHYAGTLIDGTEFDSSYGSDPVSFPLARLIRAWQLTIPQATVGDTLEIAVPASLGYGPKGAGPIPGGATLLFKIELLGIEGR